MKSCIYCKQKIDDNAAVDVCQKCGVKVWGEKMFKAIVQNMEQARDVGDLYQGSVSYPNDNAVSGVRKRI